MRPLGWSVKHYHSYCEIFTLARVKYFETGHRLRSRSHYSGFLDLLTGPVDFCRRGNPGLHRADVKTGRLLPSTAKAASGRSMLIPVAGIWVANRQVLTRFGLSSVLGYCIFTATTDEPLRRGEADT